jgi:PAS domain S-box-containing protein
MKEDPKALASRYRAIIDSQTELIIRHKPDSTVIFANKAFLKFVGLSAEDITGINWFDMAQHGTDYSTRSYIAFCRGGPSMFPRCGTVLKTFRT